MNEQTYREEQLKALGLDPTKLTEAQIDIALQPIDAPENYHQDGEISNGEAKNNFIVKMRYAGFNSIQINKIVKHYGL